MIFLGCGTSSPSQLIEKAEKDPSDTARDTTQMYDSLSLIVKKYPDYLFDKIHRIVPGPKAPVIHYNKLQSVLLSKNLERPVDELGA